MGIELSRTISSSFCLFYSPTAPPTLYRYVELYGHILLPTATSDLHTPSVEPPHNGLSWPAPVYQVWFGNGRVSGLSGSSPLFPDLQGSQAMAG